MKKLMMVLVFILCLFLISCNSGRRFLGPNDVCEYRGKLCDQGPQTYYYCYTTNTPYWEYWYELYIDGEYEYWYSWSDMYDYYCL